MADPRFPRPIAITPILVGVCLWTYFYLINPERTPDIVTLVFFALALAPYSICLAILFRGKGHPYYAFFGAVGSLVGDCVILYPIVIAPTSSTSALGILAVPFHNLFLFGPAALLVAALLQGVRRARKAP